MDLAATAVPFIPGGAATALKLGRAADAVVSVASHADEVMDVAKFANKADDAGDLAKQLDNLPCPIQNSFSAETPVLTAEGLKPISQLVEDELVYAWNETNQRLELQPIVDTISHHDPAIVLLTLTGERLETTADHPFYVLESTPWLVASERRGRWVAAGALQLGDTLWQADGETGKVLAVRIVEQPQQMYNLTVAVAHTFFVGQQHWLVHNCTQTIEISKSKYPQSAQHIEDAQASGHPKELTIDRSGAAQNRKDSLAGVQKQPGLDRDEYPPAMFQEGGQGASIRPINPSDNRGAGACIGGQCRNLPDGTKVEIVIVP